MAGSLPRLGFGPVWSRESVPFFVVFRFRYLFGAKSGSEFHFLKKRNGFASTRNGFALPGRTDAGCQEKESIETRVVCVQNREGNTRKEGFGRTNGRREVKDRKKQKILVLLASAFLIAGSLSACGAGEGGAAHA